MSIARRALAVGFVVILLIFSISLLFLNNHHMFYLGESVRSDFYDLKACWIDSYQEMNGWDIFWEILWSLPGAFALRTGITLTNWAANNGKMEVYMLGNLEDRLIYTFYVIFSDNTVYPDYPVTDWWPEIDPVTGEIIEEETE